MLIEIPGIIGFNGLSYPKYETKKYWIHEPLLNEVLTWARVCEIKGHYLAEMAARRRYCTCAFAFSTEHELGLFNLKFYDKFIEDQKTTPVYRLHLMVVELEEKTGKKII